MGVLEFVKEMSRAIRLAHKPSWDEFKLTFRIVLLGLALLGAIGFFFQLTGALFQFAEAAFLSRDILIIALVVIVAVTLAAITYLKRKYSI